MKIRNLSLAIAVAAGVVGLQAFSTASAEATSRPGVGILKSQDGGQTWQAGTANGGVWKTTDGVQAGNTYYVGSANGGVWK